MTDRDLTIVVVPDGARGEDVMAVGRAWSKAGLLQPSVWLSPTSIEETSGGLPRVLASLVSGATVEQTDLFTLVGRRRLSWVRLVVVHLGTSDVQGDDALNAAALRLSDMLRSALPLGTSEEERGTQLHRVKLIVPANGVSGLPRSVLQQDWEVNAVVSPEDRPDVNQSSIFVREDDNFTGHVVNAICAVGGLWDGMPMGALDGVTTDSTTSEGWLHVLRPTVRAILADDRTEGLVRQATDVLTDAESGDFVHWGRRAEAPDEVAARAAATVLDSTNWVTPPPIYPARSGRERRSAGDVAGAALRYNLRLFGTGWRWMVRSSERRLEHTLTRQLVGDDTDITVALRPHDPVSLTALSEATQDAEDQTVGDLLRTEKQIVDVPAPGAWRDLRRVTFALVDGDVLPEGIRGPGSSSLTEIVPRKFATPAPDDVLLLGSRRVGLVDVIGYREEIERLELELAAEAEQVAKAERAAKAEQVEAGSGQGGEDENASKKPPASAEPVTVAKHGAADRYQQARAWGARRQDNFLWLVAEDLADRLGTARARRDHLETTRRATTAEAAQKLNRAYDRLVNAWRVTVLATLVGLGVIAWIWIGGETEPADLLPALLLLLLVGIGVVAFANHRYFKADLLFRKEATDAIHERRAAAEELVTLRRDTTWLDVRYRGLMMWAPLLAELVHRPWGEVAPTCPSISAEDVDRLPAAVAIAVRAEKDTEKFSSQAVTDTVNVLCPKGFLSRRWDDVLNGFLRDSGRSSGTGSDTLDSDQLETRASPRQELLDYLVEGPARSEGVAEMVNDVDEAVKAGHVRMPPRMVTRVGRYLSLIHI